jgi:hypothetical protein
LRVANLHFAQQRSGSDKKRDDRHTRHYLSPFAVFACLSHIKPTKETIV